MKKDKKRSIIWICFIVIFLIALFFRIYKIQEQSEGMDEHHWIYRGSFFVNKLVKGEFRKSAAKFERHPGIPAAFLMGLSVNLFSTKKHYEVKSLANPFKFSLGILDPLIAARLPIAILGALSTALFFLFTKKIWGFSVGLLSGVLLALDPFHIALSRLAHQDITLTLFVFLSIFSYYLGEIKNKNSWKIASGIFFGFALLTKIVAVLIPAIIFIWKIIIYFSKKDKPKFPFKTIDFVILVIGFLIFFAFYPAMWENPTSALIKHINKNLGVENIKSPHFFAGKVSVNPIWYYYAIVIFVKLPLFTITGFLISLAIGIKSFLQKKKAAAKNLLLILTVLVFIVVMSFFGKMKDRYILPIWPFLIIAAAIGIVGVFEFSKINLKLKAVIVSLLIIIFFSPTLINFAPYYFIYYNRILHFIAGEPNNIKNLIEIGWGEGVKEAAEYLNQKQDVDTITAISSCSSCFRPYFKGNYQRWRGEEWYQKKIENNSIDYAILHMKAAQGRAPEPILEIYRKKIPEKIITINDIDVVWIYKIKE